MSEEQPFIDAIAEAVAERLRGELSRPEIKLDDLGIVPMRVYSVKHTAELLDASQGSVREIPDFELPKVRRVGSGVGYLGINIMLYAHRLPPIDTVALLRTYREALIAYFNTAPQFDSADRITRVL